MARIVKSFFLIALLLLLHLYLYQSDLIENSDRKLYDRVTQLFQKTVTTQEESHTVIVDIDEKSLKRLGQWPWPRVIDATLIDTINQNYPAAIGLNILFPESDRVSLRSIQAFYQRSFDLNLSLDTIPKRLQDNDLLFAQSIQQANTTLSIYFNNNITDTPAHCDALAYQVVPLHATTIEHQARSMICNTPQIQEGVKNFGFINASRDSDGVLRRIPMFAQYHDKVFPSFALAMLLSIDKEFKFESKEENILPNFLSTQPKIISAVDLLEGRISPSILKGKIVLVGSSVIGLSPSYITSTGERISNPFIYAVTIENLIEKRYLIQPQKYKTLNILLSFLLSVGVLWLFGYKRYLLISILFASTALLSLLWLVHTYTQGVYISLGYLWFPLFYTVIVVVTYHLRVLSKERQEQEKFLIKQSKLASMGEMISLIAHQWRQPLSAINGAVLNIDMESRKTPLNREALDHQLNKIEETTSYLSKTISDFSDFFSQGKQQERFYIADVVMQAQTLTSHNQSDDITVVYKQKENTELLGYKSELLQSILIILNNALYACQKNLPNTHQGRIIIETYESSNSVILTISDNGGGIDKKYLQKIFNPYFTTKAKPHGTGLGLYILKLIVEDSMNGSVSVNNTEDGAIFTIEIPNNLIESERRQTPQVPLISLSD
ncbi:MAG TPA: CHASE2 domain-containing protein [Campylobacterales bacterium]|nr:CHASE2 domain-containing protein [Campylobacterales bacterium]